MSNDDDDLLPPTPEQIKYLRKQKNQYAKLSVTVREGGSPSRASVVQEPAVKKTVSKEEFEAECRRILGFYVPAVEKARLRPHQRAFIARNQSRTPSARYKILNELRKYDLSDVSGLRGRFNREREELTEAKLKDIEQSVRDDE